MSNWSFACSTNVVSQDMKINMQIDFTLRSLVSMNPVEPESKRLNASRTSVFCSSDRSTLAETAMFDPAEDAATFFLAPPVMTLSNQSRTAISDECHVVRY